MTRLWTAIPNFVDCGVFRPAADADERREIRRRLDIPDGLFVVGCVAAVKKDHKRIDYLIGEVIGVGGRGSGGDPTDNNQHSTSNSQAASRLAGHEPLISTPRCLPFLLVAGAKTPESDELMELANQLLPGRNRILLDCTREQMPDVYRAMDVFVLPSLFEMMPIALLEAMASGVPCLVNRHPVLEWMIGEERGARGGGRGAGGETRSAPPSTEAGGAAAAGADSGMSAGGRTVDMAREWVLSSVLAGLSTEWLRVCGDAARQRALRVFSVESVIGQYVDYYRQVMGVT